MTPNTHNPRRRHVPEHAFVNDYTHDYFRQGVPVTCQIWHHSCRECGLPPENRHHHGGRDDSDIRPKGQP